MSFSEKKIEQTNNTKPKTDLWGKELGLGIPEENNNTPTQSNENIMDSPVSKENISKLVTYFLNSTSRGVSYGAKEKLEEFNDGDKFFIYTKDRYFGIATKGAGGKIYNVPHNEIGAGALFKPNYETEGIAKVLTLTEIDEILKKI